MRIRSQLIVAVGGAVLIVALSSVYSAQQQSRAQKLKSLALYGEQATAAVYRFEASSRAIQTDAGSYKESVKNWLEVSADTGTKLDALFLEAGKLSLSKDIAEPLQSLKEKWPKIQEYINTLQGLFDQLGQSSARVYVNTLGIVKTQIQLSADFTANYEDVQILNGILEAFQSTVLFTVNVNQDLSALNEMLVKQADVAAKQAGFVNFAFLGIAIAVSLILSYFYSSRLASRILRLEQVVEAMSGKDLSREARDASKDELGMLAENLNKVIGIMRDFMGKAQDTATSLAAVETTLTGNATELQSSSGIIVDNTEDIAKRVKELDRNIGTSVQAAKQVDTVLANFISLAESQADNLGRISTAVEEMAASMNNVSKLVESRLVNLQELQSAIQLGFDEADKSSDILARAKHELEGISEISDMIADVADKTNILSMNAAIESAHAGMSGKGFAVVAEEIRKLSDTASENASNIEKLVKSIALSLNNSSASAVQSREVLAATKTTVDTFVTAFSEIGSSTRELSLATKEILEAVSNIDASSLTIKQEGSKAAEWSRKIEGDMELVGLTSDQVVKRVASIQENINILSKALAHMNALVETTSMRSSELDAMLCEFKIEQACETEPAANETAPAEDTASGGTV